MGIVKYRAAERRAIDAAWWAALTACDRDHRAGSMMADALRIERRERSCVWSAKALLVRCFFYPPNKTCGFFDLARGCQLAAIVGARVFWGGLRYPDNHVSWARAFELADACKAAHNAAIRRALEAIQVGGGAA